MLFEGMSSLHRIKVPFFFPHLRSGLRRVGGQESFHVLCSVFLGFETTGTSLLDSMLMGLGSVYAPYAFY